jgi:hypothetical protein
VYLAPIPPHPISAWGNKHTGWRSGFIVRFLWLGYVLRWGKIPYAVAETRRRQRAFSRAIQEANDGDYPLTRSEIAGLLNYAEHGDA